ncbi:MAG: radical SAM protein [Polyangiaceae bacterium]
MMTKDERRRVLDAPRPVRRLEIVGASREHAALDDRVRPIDRRERPIYAVWEITLACDLACRHCGSRAGRARPDELSTEEAIDLVGQMAALGVREIALIGGEVYLYEGWADVVRAIRRAGITSTIVTGGRGMTLERARIAAEAGVESVAVSIDGSEESHDRLRGVRGSYAAAVAALDHLRTAGLQVAINTQINRLTAGELEGVYELLERVGGHGWQVQLTVPVGRAADEPDVILQPYDLLEVFPRLAALKRRADAAGIKMMCGNDVGYFGPYESLLRSHCVDRWAGSCPAGRSGLGVEANGDIKGCPSLGEDWIGGNIRAHSLKDIWERSRALRAMRDRTPADLSGYCAKCYYGAECAAGCTWMTTALFGRPGNNPYCHHRALEMQKKGVIERVERVDEAPGRPFDTAKWRLVEEPMGLPADGEARG